MLKEWLDFRQPLFQRLFVNNKVKNLRAEVFPFKKKKKRSHCDLRIWRKKGLISSQLNCNKALIFQNYRCRVQDNGLFRQGLANHAKLMPYSDALPLRVHLLHSASQPSLFVCFGGFVVSFTKAGGHLALPNNVVWPQEDTQWIVKTLVCLFSCKLWYKPSAIRKQELFSAKSQLCKNVTKAWGAEEKTALLLKGKLGAIKNIYVGLKYIINTKKFSTNDAKGRTRN